MSNKIGSVPITEAIVEALRRLIGAMPVIVAYGEHPMADCDCPFCAGSALLAKIDGSA